VLCLSLVLLASCGGGPTQTKDFDADNESGAPVKKGVKPEADAEAAVIDTEFGRIVVELYPNVAPQMVERFKKLAAEGFYNGTTFHRINSSVIQGGDPNSRDDDPANDGSGNSPYPNVPAEFSDVPFERGTFGAARTNDPNSANCQFYVTLTRMAQWDGRYTVFGKVIDGMNTADVISTAPKGANPESPDPKIVIRSVTLQPRAGFK
jgi:peptidylprolyl isomerase